MDWNANKMNTLHHVDPRSYQLAGGGSQRTPGGLVLAPVMAGRPLVHLPGGGGGHHPRMPHGRGPGPPLLQPPLGQMGGPHQPAGGLFVEEQMDHLAGRLDMLENELRYAWRALDVLSQEYIKMWERLEKMEGLLTEQQTVITQLIDLYTADSSDNADNSFDADGSGGGGGGGAPVNSGSKFTGFGLKDPDESFYKALNAVHRDSYPNTADTILPQDNDYPAPPPPAPGPADSNKSSTRQDKAPKLRRKQPIGADQQVQPVKQQQQQPPREKGRERRRNPAEEMEESPEQESKSVASNPSLYSSEVGEFPVPVDSSPTYENLTPLLPGNIAAAPPAGGKRRLPQVPPDTRRTRKDGYIGKPEEEEQQRTGKQAVKAKQRRPDEEAADPRLARTNLERKTSDRSTGSLNEQTGRVGRLADGGEDQEVQYDTYPRRKSKRKDKDRGGGGLDGGPTAASSPLTVIDGNLSFSLTEDAHVAQAHPQEKNPEQMTLGQQPISEAGQSRVISKANIQENEQRATAAAKSAGVDQLMTDQRRQSAGSQPQNEQEAQVKATDQDASPLLEGNVNRASSLYQQIQAREAETLQDIKSRKLSLKEKRKLRAEQRELGTELLQKVAVEVEPSSQLVSMAKKDSSESDVSMRSDHSVSPKRDSGDMELLDQGPQPGFNGLYSNDQQGARPRSNGINLLPVQQQILGSSSKSREFAVSRALGKYRQKQKERESLPGSSNSDSQEELDITGAEVRSEQFIDGTLKTADIKLAGIEESTEPECHKISLQEQLASVVYSDSVQKQVVQFEQAGFASFDMLKQPGNSQGKSRSRRQSTEESIDTEDEWYQHEMMRLEKLESDQTSHKMGLSDSLHGRMSQVVEELSSSIAVTEKRSIIQEQLEETEPPDKPPDPPDSLDEESRGEKEKKRVSKRYASDEESDSSPTASEQDDEEDDEEDSETQSGADTDVDEEEEEKARGGSSLTDVSRRPGNLTITPSEPKLNISSVPNKPDLLQEVTAAAAEAAYPDHLKNGSYGEDGLWYDERGETGYFDEDGTWFDYIDEIGYYNDDGEWIEYDYGKGYWGDDGEWHENEAQKDESATSNQHESPKDETDHFLWVSEEGIKGKTSNDQIPSSELKTSMVIGKPTSGSREDQQPRPDSTAGSASSRQSSQHDGNNQHRDSTVTEASTSPDRPQSDDRLSETEHLTEKQRDSVSESAETEHLTEKQRDSVSESAETEQLLDEQRDSVSGMAETEQLLDEQRDSVSGMVDTVPTVRKGGKRWGTLIKQHTAELIELVSI